MLAGALGDIGGGFTEALAPRGARALAFGCRGSFSLTRGERETEKRERERETEKEREREIVRETAREKNLQSE